MGGRGRRGRGGPATRRPRAGGLEPAHPAIQAVQLGQRPVPRAGRLVAPRLERGAQARQLVPAGSELCHEALLANLQRSEPCGQRRHGPACALDRVDHLDVAVVDPLEKGDTLQKIREPVGLEKNGQRVGPITLEAGPELARQDRLVALHAGLKLDQAPTCGPQRISRPRQLVLLGGDVGLDRGEASRRAAHARVQGGHAIALRGRLTAQRLSSRLGRGEPARAVPAGGGDHHGGATEGAYEQRDDRPAGRPPRSGEMRHRIQC